MFAVSLVLAWIAAADAIVIVAGLLALIGKLVGTWLMFVLIVPLHIAFLLMMFTVMFGVMYYLWRDVCGDDIVTGMALPIAA